MQHMSLRSRCLHLTNAHCLSFWDMLCREITWIQSQNKHLFCTKLSHLLTRFQIFEICTFFLVYSSSVFILISYNKGGWRKALLREKLLKPEASTEIRTGVALECNTVTLADTLRRNPKTLVKLVLYKIKLSFNHWTQYTNWICRTIAQNVTRLQCEIRLV